MPKKPDTSGSEDQALAIDPQKKYLMDQFGSLMEKVGDGFGIPLQEELVRRLEQTIADFHEEVTELLENLKDNSEKRHDRHKEIWNNPDAAVDDDAPDESDDGPGDESDMSEYEKRIEGLEGDSKNDAPQEKDEKPKKKKGFFGRKKK